MKITNHEVIKSGEQELIDAITAELDWESIEDKWRCKRIADKYRRPTR